MLQYRRPLLEEFDQLLLLQNSNLASMLNPTERLDGFLSTAFTLEQFKAMDEDVGIIVGVEKQQIYGYLCASTPAFNKNFLFPSAMLHQCEKISYQSRPIFSYRVVVVNPMCIHKHYRGKNIFVGLCQKMLTLITPTYELAIGFIAAENKRSLEASKKMQIEIIDEFIIKQQHFLIWCRKI